MRSKKKLSEMIKVLIPIEKPFLEQVIASYCPL
jgi:hypothetical protein